MKIREKERVEPPHVSILKGTETWRWGLRERDFLDKRPLPKLVPRELLALLEINIRELIENWDRMYPHNKVVSEDKS